MSPLRQVFFSHKGTKPLSFTKFIVLINNTLCASVPSVSLWFSFFKGFRSGLNNRTKKETNTYVFFTTFPSYIHTNNNRK